MFLTRLSRVRRRTRGEAGQTLVEYALIIAVVSLGAVAALTFLRDEITAVFNDSGSALQEAGAAGGSGGGGGTPPPPPPSLPTVPTQVSPGVWFAPESAVSGGPDSYDAGSIDVTGVFSDSGGPVGAACSFTVPPGAQFTGVWINRDTGPGNDDWEINGDGSGGGYDWACLAVPAPAVPQPGSAAISCVPAGPCDEDDGLRAVASGFTNGPDDYQFDFQWASAGGNDCSSPGAVIDNAVVDSGDADVNVSITNFSGNRCYRVRARADNNNGFGPYSNYSNWLFVDDD